MPRLSLYRPEKSKDYKFFDRTILEMFQVGGVEVHVHKYIGPVDPTDSSKALGATTIQDVLFLENRDRKYDLDVYTLRGHYQTQDIDFNLSQFGLFLTNDTVFMTVHLNNSVDLIGRKLMPGDVFELPNLREEYIPDYPDAYRSTNTYYKGQAVSYQGKLYVVNSTPGAGGTQVTPTDVNGIIAADWDLTSLNSLNALTNFHLAIKKFYVVEEINRAAEGFSATWYPHLYRLKLKPITASQEFADILNQPANTDTYAGAFDPNLDPPKTYYPGQTVTYNGQNYTVINAVGPGGTQLAPPDSTAWYADNQNTLSDLMSTYNISLELNNAVIAEAESDAPLSGYETSQYYTLAVDPLTGRSLLNTIDNTVNSISDIDGNVSDVNAPPIRDGYKGYLIEDGAPPNGPLASDAQFGFGIQFPMGPVRGDTFLRTDYLPNRLFLWDGARWVKQEDNVRMTMTNTDTRQTLKTSFINNTAVSGIDKAGWDTVVVGDAFDPAGITTLFTVNPSNVVIVTSLNYNANFKVEVWLNESSQAQLVTNQNVSGKFGFTIPETVDTGVRIRYTIFATYVEQRQSVSKALRKIKPEADI
jgi:hypothetical protein